MADHGRCAVGKCGRRRQGSQSCRYFSNGSRYSGQVHRCGDLVQKGHRPECGFKKPSPEVAGTAYNQLGQAYAKMGNGKDSADNYELAAKTQPANAAQYYFNEAATLYNAGKTAEAGAAADKAIAADPKKAEAYYIKGQTLIGQATVDPKTQKITAPPGCVEAYQTYLELAPDGPHAADVKGILAGIGEQVKSTYKAPKK